ncbi:DUF4381 family protein [Pedobacter sp. HMF7647]|uniref:DUF4381 family protein n=1 Tax=Hufsiella arboris TaxID=2695275 RepID=A0A7K1YF61_9SPHI|nr:DUF4381 domain-containing protein [Hufsiella arboris]MXV53244.1 DUF4381 family protein [Hufsiella arboris]
MNNDIGTLIEPQPVPFTFGAPGWYVLGVLILIILLVAGWLIMRHYQLNRYRAEAVHYLEQLIGAESDNLSPDAPAALVYESQMLLKRIAMKNYGRRLVAGERESGWTDFINSTWRERSFDENDARLFGQAIYSREVIKLPQATEFADKVRRWIRQHKRRMRSGATKS